MKITDNAEFNEMICDACGFDYESVEYTSNYCSCGDIKENGFCIHFILRNYETIKLLQIIYDSKYKLYTEFNGDDLNDEIFENADNFKDWITPILYKLEDEAN